MPPEGFGYSLPQATGFLPVFSVALNRLPTESNYQVFDFAQIDSLFYSGTDYTQTVHNRKTC
jgi:hypothetical protein